MAKALGCEIRVLDFGYDETIHDFDAVEKAIVEFKPKMITMVQNETPSGTTNPVKEIGDLKVKHGVPLLCVDIVSGLGGTRYTWTIGMWISPWVVRKSVSRLRLICHSFP